MSRPPHSPLPGEPGPHEHSQQLPRRPEGDRPDRAPRRARRSSAHRVGRGRRRHHPGARRPGATARVGGDRSPAGAAAVPAPAVARARDGDGHFPAPTTAGVVDARVHPCHSISRPRSCDDSWASRGGTGRACSPSGRSPASVPVSVGQRSSRRSGGPGSPSPSSSDWQQRHSCRDPRWTRASCWWSGGANRSWILDRHTSVGFDGSSPGRVAEQWASAFVLTTRPTSGTPADPVATRCNDGDVSGPGNLRRRVHVGRSIVS